METKGFSLIEFLIYMSILVIAVTGINLTAINIFQTTAKSDTIAELAYNGQFTMHKIKSNINNSDSIVRPTTEGEELELTQNGSSLLFKVAEGNLILEKDGIISDLTTSQILIEKINFKKISSDSIRITIKLSHENPEGLSEKAAGNVFISSASLK